MIVSYSVFSSALSSTLLNYSHGGLPILPLGDYYGQIDLTGSFIDIKSAFFLVHFHSVVSSYVPLDLSKKILCVRGVYPIQLLASSRKKHLASGIHSPVFHSFFIICLP